MRFGAFPGTTACNEQVYFIHECVPLLRTVFLLPLSIHSRSYSYPFIDPCSASFILIHYLSSCSLWLLENLQTGVEKLIKFHLCTEVTISDSVGFRVQRPIRSWNVAATYVSAAREYRPSLASSSVSHSARGMKGSLEEGIDSLHVMNTVPSF